VPKNDAAAAAALQAVINGTALLPEPDDPLYHEAFQAGLLAVAAAGGHQQQQHYRGSAHAAQEEDADGDMEMGEAVAAANPAAVAVAHAAAPGELHGMPISVAPVRTITIKRAAVTPTYLKRMAAATGSPDAQSPPHSGHSHSQARSSAAQFQLEAGGSGSVDARGGSPPAAGGALKRRHAAEDDMSGHSNDSTPKVFGGQQQQQSASGSPSVFHVGSSFSPLSGRKSHGGGAGIGVGAVETPISAPPKPRGLAATLAIRRHEQELVSLSARPSEQEPEVMEQEESETPRCDSEDAQAAADVTCGSDGGFKVGSPALGQDGSPFAAPAIGSRGERSSAFVAEAANDALVHALLKKHQEEEQAAAAAAAAGPHQPATAALEHQHQQALMFEALQQRNSETMASLKQLVGAIGPQTATTMLPTLTKLPAVQLLLRSIQHAAPGLVATVAQEQRAMAVQRAALVLQQAGVRQALMMQVHTGAIRQQQQQLLEAQAAEIAAAGKNIGGSPSLAQQQLRQQQQWQQQLVLMSVLEQNAGHLQLAQAAACDPIELFQPAPAKRRRTVGNEAAVVGGSCEFGIPGLPIICEAKAVAPLQDSGKASGGSGNLDALAAVAELFG